MPAKPVVHATPNPFNQLTDKEDNDEDDDSLNNLNATKEIVFEAPNTMKSNKDISTIAQKSLN